MSSSISVSGTEQADTCQHGHYTPMRMGGAGGSTVTCHELQQLTAKGQGSAPGAQCTPHQLARGWVTLGARRTGSACSRSVIRILARYNRKFWVLRG